MSATIDQQFVEYIVKTIVGNPDAVSIKRTIDEKGVLLELTVDAEDLGRVIGKRGSGAQSLRTLLRALGTKNDARYNLKIVDVGDGRDRPPREAQPRSDSEESTTRDRREENNEEAPREESSRDASSHEKETEEPKQEQASEPVAPEEEKPEEETVGSSFDRTRRELADLDDLDI